MKVRLKMGHEKARLASSSVLGSHGELVSIDAVEQMFDNSSEANSAALFECASCGVKVHAVITKNRKRGRKTSPSSYFSSSPKKHEESCNRHPELVAQSSGQANALRPAAPSKDDAPTLWRPASQATPDSRSGAAEPDSRGDLEAKSTKILSTGNRASLRSSQYIEPFASAWHLMSKGERIRRPLRAPWNPGGTYETAFFDLVELPLVEDPESQIRIYSGTVEDLRKVPTGYVVALNEIHSGAGHPLWIWIREEVKKSSGGEDLWLALGAGLRPGTRVCALGSFRFTTRNSGSWYALAVTGAESFYAF